LGLRRLGENTKMFHSNNQWYIFWRWEGRNLEIIDGITYLINILLNLNLIKNKYLLIGMNKDQTNMVNIDLKSKKRIVIAVPNLGLIYLVNIFSDLVF